MDSIVACDLAQGFDLRDADSLTTRIETGTGAFIEEMEGLLPKGPATRRARFIGVKP